MRSRINRTIFAVFLAVSGLNPALAAPQSTASDSLNAVTKIGTDYADTAGLVLRSPIIIDARIRQIERLKGADAAGAPANKIRVYITADVLALIRGTDSLPQRISYIVDIAPDSRGRLPALKKARVLLYAQPAGGSASQVRLSGPDSQREWTAALDTQTRAITREVLDPNAPPAITGIGNAFYVPGSLPGEGETQIFLTTQANRPVSINVLRRPGEARQWAVALSEIVDEAAAPPLRDTLLWYRLACALPPALPSQSLGSASPQNAAEAREDYQFVRRALGPCSTNLPG
ncbi:MAG: hypothetical protein WC803_05935 [Sphingomonas sp.]|jgi:hypothetical protein